MADKKPHGNTGRKRSDETKDKIRAKLLGRKRGPYSDEHRQAISDAKKGKPATAAVLAANRRTAERLRGVHRENGLTGYKQTEEHRAKIGAAQLGKKRSEEACRNISKGRKGIVFSHEQRRAMSEAAKQRWARDDVHAFRSKIEKRVGWLVEMFGFRQQFRIPGYRHPYDYGNEHTKVVIEVNGCFWHSHGCGRICGEEVRVEDAKHAAAAQSAGYKLIVLWQCEEVKWPLLLKQEGVF